MFRKYSHIQNSYQTAYIERIREWTNKDTRFVAQEKVDGTNFQFFINRNEESKEFEINCGKRSSEIAPNESFFNYKELLAQMTPKLKDLYDIMSYYHYDVSKGIIVYGEYFGKGIQSRIFYTENQDFYGFDIYLPSIGEIINPIEATNLFQDVGIFCAENLHIGTLDEMLALDVTFLSTIPERLGYKNPENNYAEGYVIKPIDAPYFAPNGDRIIIKHKNSKFIEIGQHKKEKKVIEPGNPLKYRELLDAVDNYFTVARLENCKSHLGDIELPNDFGKLLKELCCDVLNEFLEDENYKAIYDSLEKNDQKMLKTEINKKSVALIKETYMNG